MDQETFDREIAMCRKLHRENGGRCNWGKCVNCGVIPILYKLHKGRLVEEVEEVRKLKEEIFSKEI